MSEPEPAMSLSAAAKRCGVSRSTIRRKHEKGAFTGAFLSTAGAWMIPLADLIDAGLIARTAPTVYPVTMLTNDPGEAMSVDRPPLFCAQPAQIERGQGSNLAQVAALTAALADAVRRAEVAEAVAHERGLALERADRAMRIIEAAPTEPAQVPTVVTPRRRWGSGALFGRPRAART